MRRRIDDKEALLKSREDELACLSTSLLEKEKLLRGACVVFFLHFEMTVPCFALMDLTQEAACQGRWAEAVLEMKPTCLRRPVCSTGK